MKFRVDPVPVTVRADSVLQMEIEPMVTRNFRVPPPLWHQAKTKAERQGEHLSDVLRAALQSYVADPGDEEQDASAAGWAGSTEPARPS